MFLLMWQAMMMVMMLPSMVPMLRSFQMAQEHLGVRGAGVLMLLAAAGYFFVWFLIGVCVYAMGVLLALAAMRYSMLSRAVPLLSGAAMIISGGIQFTPWKRRALRRCRAPAACPPIQTAGKYRAAWRQGLGWGASCSVCSSGLMLALLVLGMMNLIVMVTVASVIGIERLTFQPEWIVCISGVAAAGSGLFMLVHFS
jgi:predicted metal-binding membrane protein